MLGKAKGYLATHKTIDIALLVATTLLATSRWFNLDIPKGHDALGDMLLAQAASHTISLHNLLSRWSGDWFLGYPLFYVHPPLASFLIWALSYPFGWILGTKLLYLCFYILSGVFAYFYVYELTRNRPASFVAGLAYIFLPYHILEVGLEGHHGAFGMPYMLTPLTLLLLEKLVRNPGIKYVLVNAMLLALLTLTYPQVFPFLVGPFLALYVILRIWWQRQRGVKYVKSAALASIAAFCLPLLLTAFWWLPLLSEIRYFAATSFPLQEARDYSATFLQAITLRPSFCCAPSSAYGASGSIILEMLRMLPFVLVVFGIILNRRNKYVWFFSVSILIAVLLAMGPDSPVKLFTLAYRYVPFFSGLRTPWRFLLFTSLAYAVVIGFFVKGVSEWLGRLHPRRLGRSGVLAIVLVLISLIVLGNTWQETRTAFDTFTLTNDQRNAFSWLETQDNGDYRITDLPFKTWTYSTENRWVINPVYWTYLHGKQTVYGGVPAAATLYAGDTLEYLNYSLQNGSDLDEWLSVFNVRYVVLDKTDPATANVNLGKDFELVWPSTTIDIYENHAMKPMIFSVSSADQRDVALWSAGSINVFLADGSKDVAISLEDAHTRSSNLTLEAKFRLSGPEAEWSKLGIDVGDMSLDRDDEVHLVFYSENDLPDVHVSLDALESDGSRYGMDLNRVDGIEAGWNEIDFPLSLLLLNHSIGGNDHLDFDQIKAIWFGVGQKDGVSEVGEFSLYFDTLSVVSQEINTDVEYAQTSPGKYQVHVKSDSPFRLILSESYHPNWVARVNGTTIHSEITYESLNSFDLQPGDYDVKLKFVPSTLRTAGGIISSISALLVLLVGVVLLMRWRSRKT
jgi:hypothetical protein